MAGTNVLARRWVGDLSSGNVAIEDERVGLAIERDVDGVAIHTMVNGTGSHASYYMSREEAIHFARDVLSAVMFEEEV